MATRPWSWRTPDARLRDIKYARQVEEERAAELDEQDNQRLLGLQAEMETEQARSADLDRQDGIQEQMRFEQKRAADLDVAGAPQYEPGGRVLPAEAAPILREMTPRWGRWEKGVFPAVGEPGMELGETVPQESPWQRVHERYGEYLDTNLATLDQQNQRRAALGLTPLTEEDMKERAWQRAIADVEAPAPGAAEFLGKGAALTAGLVGGIAGEGLRNIAGLEAQTFIPEALRGGEVSPGGVVPPFLVPPQLQQEVSRESPTETLERLPRSVQLGLEAAPFAVFGPGLAAEMGVGGIIGGEIGERTPIGREWGEAAGFLGGPAVSRGLVRPLASGITTRTPEAMKPMTEADIMGGRADIAGTTAADIPAGARGTPGELRVMQETAAEYGAKPWAPVVSAEGVRADILAGGTVTKLVDALKAAKPVRGEVEAAKSEALRAKAAGIHRAFEETTGIEALYRGRAAQVGELPKPAVFEAVQGQFTQTEVNALMDAARLHPAFAARPHDKLNAMAALADVLQGRLPTRGEIALMERFYGPELSRELAKKIPLGKKAWTSFVDLLNLPRTVLAAFDVSFPLRQGLMVGARHPKEWIGNLPELFRSGISPKRAQFLDDALRTDSTLIKTGTERGEATVAQLAEESGLFRPSIEGIELMEREEFFLSNLAKRLPIVGVGVRFSERSFISYGNKLRQDIFRNTLLSWQNSGKQIAAKDASDLANLINRMTGRGTLQAMLPGGMEANLNSLAPLLSAGFFAPRFAVSRPQALLQMFSTNPRIRSLAAQEIVSFVGLGVSVLSTMKLAGFDVELSPLSTDFGKIKVGKTRFDFWGGNIQWARLMAQLATGKRKGPDGVIVDTDKLAGLGRFTRYKLSPPAALMMDWFLGETPIGEEFPPGTNREALEQAFQRLTPLALQDLVEAVREYGMSGFMAMPAFGGVGVQTYETLAEMFERKTGQKWSETPSDRRRELIAGDEELLRYTESREAGAGERIRENRSQTLLPLAEAVIAGTPGAARNYHENRPNIMVRFSGASEEAYKDLDIPIVGEDNRILDEYYAVDFLRDWDGNDIPGDDEDVRMALEHQDTLRSQLSPAVQKAMDNPEVDFPDKEVVEAEKRRNLAVDRVRHLIENIPKYQGATAEYCEEVDDYVRYVRQEWKDAKREYGDRFGWSQTDAAIELGRQEGKKDLGYDAALVISQDVTWNPEYNQFLVDNQEAIAPFFPGMYQRTIFREKGVLTDEIWAEVTVPIPSPAGRQEVRQGAGMEQFREVEQRQQPSVR